MYLVKTTNGDKILNSADAVKSIKKEDIEKIYFLTEVNYDSVISNADIRDCIYSYVISAAGLYRDITIPAKM